jgi:AbiV family abortive infection protein
MAGKEKATTDKRAPDVLPTNEEIVSGIRKTFANAEALVEDAKALQAAGRYPRAIALAILAMEELGKLERFSALLMYAREGRLRDWWRKFRRHDVKAQMFLINSLIQIPMGDEARADTIRAFVQVHIGSFLHEAKMLVLYTDFRDGQFVSPADFPDAKEFADDLIRTADAALALDRVYASRVTPEALSSMDKQSHEVLEKVMLGGIALDEFIGRAMGLIHEKVVGRQQEQGAALSMARLTAAALGLSRRRRQKASLSKGKRRRSSVPRQASPRLENHDDHRAGSEDRVSHKQGGAI